MKKAYPNLIVFTKNFHKRLCHVKKSIYLCSVKEKQEA